MSKAGEAVSYVELNVRYNNLVAEYADLAARYEDARALVKTLQLESKEELVRKHELESQGLRRSIDYLEKKLAVTQERLSKHGKRWQMIKFLVESTDEAQKVPR